MGVNGDNAGGMRGTSGDSGHCCGSEKNVRVLIILKKLKKWAPWGGRLLHD